ncbi:MAG: M56 family metallopeptidase [Acidobacteria bacterium]|nr:M56 family metallopeptidase [Acidobacteriota bacterium]
MFLLYKVTLVLCASALLAVVCRRASAAVRHLVWMMGLAAALLAPFAGAVIAPVTVPIEFRFAANASGAAGTSAPEWAAWIWLAGSIVVGLRFLLAHVRAAAIVRTAKRNGETRGVELRTAPSQAMPFTWGLLRPVIVAPGGTAPEVVLHELAHAARKDHWWLIVSQLACAVYWFHPGVWWAARQARIAREHACDDWAIRQGAAPVSYAESLVEVARSGLQAQLGTASAAGQTPLEPRLRMILDSTTDRRPVRRWMLAAAAMLAVIAAVPTATAQKVYKIADGITPPKLLTKVEPAYTPEARKARISGTVVMSLEIHEDGKAHNFQITQPLDAGLDQQAIKAVQKWTFAPAKKDGQAVRCMATIEVNFRIE